ncbi:hypothetical protein GCM10025868_40000 [Angustibacter aerolatus]|uniref:Uncharacterized protein n=1 Tax=Angustibacter aerolatus TaxID=1162965 RepID=A0ABQ6JPV5_9ACTN|nr:hypothetical protein GCM10025868_40000 [Angustibacter aerolatus]
MPSSGRSASTAARTRARLGVVAVRARRLQRGVRCLPVVPRVDVDPTRHHQPVEPGEQRPGRLGGEPALGWQQHHLRARPAQRATYRAGTSTAGTSRQAPHDAGSA